jgi:hypothetical protein
LNHIVDPNGVISRQEKLSGAGGFSSPPGRRRLINTGDWQLAENSSRPNL